jgi:HSP20 family protein
MKAMVQKEARPNTEQTAARREFVTPEVNIFETKDGYTLQAEMPGVNKDGLEITLEGTEITIVGHRHTEALPGEALFRESQQWDYRRVFELDPAIDTTKVNARMDQGVLTLTLPKSERVKPRRIKVD